MEWVLFGIVVVFGAVGLGQVGRQRLLDATKPALPNRGWVGDGAG